jgi:hypothetical protein
VSNALIVVLLYAACGVATSLVVARNMQQQKVRFHDEHGDETQLSEEQKETFEGGMVLGAVLGGLAWPLLLLGMLLFRIRGILRR